MVVTVGYLGALTVLAVYNSQGNDPVVPQAGTRASATVIVQNVVITDNHGFREDRYPLYLSTRTEPYCALRGCRVPGFTARTGDRLLAVCFTFGHAMTNLNLWSLSARSNPHRASSDLWYLVIVDGGLTGYVSEVYLTPGSRNGLGLRSCRGPRSR
jgi:hypothetical protein